MCGIFGIIADKDSTLDRRVAGKILRNLHLLSQTRGKEASGFALVEPEHASVLKRPVSARQLLKHAAYHDMQRRLAAIPLHAPFAALGHARMVTNGSSHAHANNQPVIKRNYLCIHNGIFVNDAEIWQKYPNLERQNEVDTEALLALVEKFRGESLTFLDSVKKAFGLLKGGNSIAVVSPADQAVVLASSNGSLYVAKSASGKETFFSSEQFILEKALKDVAIGGIEQIAHGEVRHFSLPVDKSENIEDFLPQAREQNLYRPLHAEVVAKNLSAKASLLKIDFDAIRKLKRCTRCVLPETFPFIQFDEKGVCSFCNNPRAMKLRGQDELRKYVEKYKTPGKIDCLVPISGGRDSCYGLYYIKRELGMAPVAYTYDWGMVTDLARRNISRMCGALDVEHILISADISLKRENIRKNVIAWLKKPHLGTIPLFMAGDKQFFYYANLLKKQLKLGTILFSMNPLERTDFKFGFCGIYEEHKKDQRYSHNLKWLNKMRMLGFYGKEFLTNPSYLNSSLMDSFFGFLSYYVVPDDYETIYDYIKWDEDTIVNVLKNEFDWETSPDTASTWRIGDGTASFYNYIYCRVAGFCENDTFRSNLIRNGQLTREAAMELIYEENRPRFESIQWYCSTVGLDFDETIKRINTMKPLYRSS